MDVKGNNFCINNTFRFLFPIMRMYGDGYMSHMSSLYKQGVFIDDIAHPNISNMDMLYIVVNTELSKNISEDLEYFDMQPYLTNRYIYSVHNKTKVPDRIVLMMNMPAKYNRVFKRFTEGKYDMFSDDDVNRYFVERTKENAPFFRYCRNVLLRKRVEKPPKLGDEVLGL